jgi:hypothetical protein
MSGSKPRGVRGCCGACGSWKTNGRGNWGLTKAMRKRGVKRRFNDVRAMVK